MKKFLKISIVIIICLVILIIFWSYISYLKNKNLYKGNKNLITNEWCDYGFDYKNKECCDEDDYSCEICTWKDYDCSDFDTQEQAQNIYETCKDFYISEVDIHN